MNVNYMFVDVQGFKDCNNNFIIKELALATLEQTQVFLVKPPYAYSSLSNEEKRQVTWIERNRGIFWREGLIDYREFKRNMKSFLSNKNIFVKGHEKIKWLNELCNNCSIVDIGEKGCPKFFNLYKDFSIDSSNYYCCVHKKHCALKNVICIRKWFYENNMYKFSFFS